MKGIVKGFANIVPKSAAGILPLTAQADNQENKNCAPKKGEQAQNPPTAAPKAILCGDADKRNILLKEYRIERIAEPSKNKLLRARL